MEERFHTFTVLISNINRFIRKIKTEEMVEFNLKSPHVSCLYYLLKMGSLTAKELCDICQEDKASLSRSIDYLETNGYLVCDSNLKKRYKSPLTLTTEGKKIAEIISQKIDSILNLASNGLDDSDRSILYQSLQLISNNLEKFCQKYEGED